MSFPGPRERKEPSPPFKDPNPDKRDTIESITSIKEGTRRIVKLTKVGQKIKKKVQDNKNIWEPVMTKKEAEKWSRNSIVKTDCFHVTREDVDETIEDIERGGLKIKNTSKGFGSLWGRGIYLSLDKKSSDMYLNEFSKQFICKINIKNPVYITTKDIKKYNDSSMEILTEKYPKIKEEVKKLISEIKNKSYLYKENPRGSNIFIKTMVPKDFTYSEYKQITTKALENVGYDAIIIEDDYSHSFSVGGNQVLIFDPKKVTIIKE
ncbi:hypothetical protein M0R19_04650 [Candidatus Pacearchaeota archaeon]|jgi:hypothetical protein|nr:hypothetical protein [Candidatus Pacearchaeota archaeon]